MSELKPSKRLLMGPGPSNVHYRILRAMATPLVGHLDPQFLQIMDELSGLLRKTFQTNNRITLALSGTGSAGMEAALVNTLETGDEAVICINGVFGQRMREVADRCGAKVISIEAPWGEPLDVQQIIETLKQHPQAKICGIVHAETSTGVLQPLAELGEYIKGTDTLFVVDAVTSLSGVDLKLDDWNIDVCYSATQKCLGVPPGLAPISFSEKALRVVNSRQSKVQSWYLDMTLLTKYWGAERVYHHTAPITMNYALREGLRLVDEEGLENRFARHERVARRARHDLSEMGFTFYAKEGFQCPSLISVYPPQGLAVEETRKKLLTDYNIEVGSGLGPVAGKIWRIGNMGDNAREDVWAMLLDALNQMIKG